jgi:hypothetical protein
MSSRTSKRIQAKPWRVTPGTSPRQVKKLQIALHIHPLAKRNPNCDVRPIENPYIINESINIWASFDDIVEK